MGTATQVNVLFYCDLEAKLTYISTNEIFVAHLIK
jgi:hypothetical protein